MPGVISMDWYGFCFPLLVVKFRRRGRDHSVSVSVDAQRARALSATNWTQPPGQSEGFLRQWCFSATRSRLAPVKEAASTIKQHWDGVLRKIDCATRSAQSGQRQTTHNSAMTKEGGGGL